MTPLNNSIVATRCFIFAQGNRVTGTTINETVQLGWDAELRTVWVIAECGCYRLLPTDKTFPEFETARMFCRQMMEESRVYGSMEFRKFDRPGKPKYAVYSSGRYRTDYPSITPAGEYDSLDKAIAHAESVTYPMMVMDQEFESRGCVYQSNTKAPNGWESVTA